MIMVNAKGLTYKYISINADGPTMVVECEIPGTPRDITPRRATLEFDIQFLKAVVHTAESNKE